MVTPITNGKRRPGRLVVAVVLLVASAIATHASDLERVLPGTWTMEDVFTIHRDSERDLRIETHPADLFLVPVELYADGTGSIDGARFAWSVSDDQMLWRFEHGGAVRMATRISSTDEIITLALSPRRMGPAGSLGLLRRQTSLAPSE